MAGRTPAETREWLLSDLAAHSMQSSWDWTADQRFAEFLGDVAMCEALRVLIESNAVSTIRASYHDAYIRPLTERRLRALRSLVREGLVMAYWQGPERVGVRSSASAASACTCSPDWTAPVLQRRIPKVLQPNGGEAT